MSDSPVRFQRLLPAADGAPDDVGDLLDAAFATLSPPAERPYTLANFVSSLDGRAAFQGRSSALGDDGDHAIFHGLRERVDGVLAGTATIGAEGYGRMLADPAARARRAGRGLSPEPLACTLTRSGHLPLGAPLFAEPEAQVVVFGPESVRPQLDGCAAKVHLVALSPEELVWPVALHRLRTDFGVGTLLCEGGPSVFGALLGARLIDELFLTLSAHLVGGGDGPTISHGPELADLAAVEYRWLLRHEQTLYARLAVTF